MYLQILMEISIELGLCGLMHINFNALSMFICNVIEIVLFLLHMYKRQEILYFILLQKIFIVFCLTVTNINGLQTEEVF